MRVQGKAKRKQFELWPLALSFKWPEHGDQGTGSPFISPCVSAKCVPSSTLSITLFQSPKSRVK